MQRDSDVTVQRLVTLLLSDAQQTVTSRDCDIIVQRFVTLLPDTQRAVTPRGSDVITQMFMTFLQMRSEQSHITWQ